MALKLPSELHPLSAFDDKELGARWIAALEAAIANHPAVAARYVNQKTPFYTSRERMYPFAAETPAEFEAVVSDIWDDLKHNTLRFHVARAYDDEIPQGRFDAVVWRGFDIAFGVLVAVDEQVVDKDVPANFAVTAAKEHYYAERERLNGPAPVQVSESDDAEARRVIRVYMREVAIYNPTITELISRHQSDDDDDVPELVDTRDPHAVDDGVRMVLPDFKNCRHPTLLDDDDDDMPALVNSDDDEVTYITVKAIH